MIKPSAYPPLDGLVDLACRDGIDIRPTLLRVLTDLYVQKPTHSAEEETQYVELALGLIETVDEPTRAAVVASLAKYPAAPAAVLGKLAGAKVSMDSDAPLPNEAAPDDLAEMFFSAGTEERRLILTNLDASAGAPTRRQPLASSEVIRRLEIAALQCNAGEFSRMLERALGISPALAERIVRDRSGEPIVVAAKALGMKAAVLQRVLLFLNPTIGQSVERVHTLARLFDDVTPAAAERMLAIWRKTGGRSQPTHEAALWDDERRSARSLSTPARHGVVRGRDEQASRFKSGGR